MWLMTWYILFKTNIIYLYHKGILKNIPNFLRMYTWSWFTFSLRFGLVCIEYVNKTQSNTYKNCHLKKFKFTQSRDNLSTVYTTCLFDQSLNTPVCNGCMHCEITLIYCKRYKEMRLAFSYAFKLPVLSPGESLYKKKLKKKQTGNPLTQRNQLVKIVIIIMYMYGKN